MKKRFIFGTVLSFFFIFVAGCSHSNEEQATISANVDSAYTNTFKDLDLGILYDFNLKLPNADKSWVNLWVEKYQDGEMEVEPITELSYGNSPNKVEEGHLGFGMINPDTKDPLVFLYGPSVRSHPSIMKKEPNTDVITSWDYAIGDEKVELELGETKTLAVYRESKGNSMRTVELQDEDSVKKMIEEDGMVLLLKIKVEERIID